MLRSRHGVLAAAPDSVEELKNEKRKHVVDVGQASLPEVHLRGTSAIVARKRGARDNTPKRRFRCTTHLRAGIEFVCSL